MVELENRSSARRPTTRSPPRSASRVNEFQDNLTRSRARRWPRSTSSGRSLRPAATRLADRHDRGPARRRPARAARTELREALADAIPSLPEREKPGHHALLLRGADAARDRRGARRHRVPRLAAAHEGGPAPARCGCRARSTTLPRRIPGPCAATWRDSVAAMSSGRRARVRAGHDERDARAGRTPWSTAARGSMGGAVRAARSPRQGRPSSSRGGRSAALEAVAKEIRAAGGAAESAVVDALDHGGGRGSRRSHRERGRQPRCVLQRDRSRRGAGHSARRAPARGLHDPDHPGGADALRDRHGCRAAHDGSGLGCHRDAFLVGGARVTASHGRFQPGLRLDRGAHAQSRRRGRPRRRARRLAYGRTSRPRRQAGGSRRTISSSAARRHPPRPAATARRRSGAAQRSWPRTAPAP